jgi:nitroreductase
MNEVIKTINQRRAVRKYKSFDVSRTLIEQIIDAGRMAPSALGKEPWKFYVVTSKEDIKLYSSEIVKQGIHTMPKLSLKKVFKAIVTTVTHASSIIDFLREDDPVFHGAPVVIFITANADDEWAALDIGMCAQNMLLASKSLGLESCPIGFATYIEKTTHFSKLEIPKDEKVYLAVIIGYGNETPKPHERIKSNIFYK